jgi:hypothetical protein
MTSNGNPKRRDELAPHDAEETKGNVEAAADVPNEPLSDPDQLREEIIEAREELAETVEALAQKANVKAQLTERLTERKKSIRATQEQARHKITTLWSRVRDRPPLAMAGAAVVGGIVLWWLIRKD